MEERAHAVKSGGKLVNVVLCVEDTATTVIGPQSFKGHNGSDRKRPTVCL